MAAFSHRMLNHPPVLQALQRLDSRIQASASFTGSSALSAGWLGAVPSRVISLEPKQPFRKTMVFLGGQRLRECC